MSRQVKLINFSVMAAITTEVVIEAFDRMVGQTPQEVFALVVPGNANVHRSAHFQLKRLDRLSQRVHAVYISTYSPALNLIEILWRKVKYELPPLTAYENRIKPIAASVDPEQVQARHQALHHLVAKAQGISPPAAWDHALMDPGC